MNGVSPKGNALGILRHQISGRGIGSQNESFNKELSVALSPSVVGRAKSGCGFDFLDGRPTSFTRDLDLDLVEEAAFALGGDFALPLLVAVGLGEG